MLRLLWFAALGGCAGSTPADSGKTGTEDSTGTGDTDTATDSGDTGDCVLLADGSCVTETWVDLPDMEQVDGVYQLSFGPTEFTIDGERYCGRGYNGMYPGPTLDIAARSGDEDRKVRINFKNEFTSHEYKSLDGDDTCACTDSAGEECLPHGHGGCDAEDNPDCTCTNSKGETCEDMYDFNLTNVHAHGSHISPAASAGGGCVPTDGLGPGEPADGYTCRDCDDDACDDDTSDDTCYYSDDVLAQVHPGTGIQIQWSLDEDGTHHDGLNWYHPHIHGATAIQVASGSEGAWIIRGPVDDVPGLANARERVFVFTTPPVGDNGFVPLEDGEACTEDTLTFDNFEPLGNTHAKQKNLLNGVETPRMITPPGQVERWRFLNGGFLDESWFGIFRGGDSDCTTWSVADSDTLPLTQYARDGITLPQTFTAPYFFMSSGYRIEGTIGGDGVLDDGDTWCLVAGRFLEEGPDGLPVEPGDEPSADDVEQLLSVGSVIGILNVTSNAGSPTETVPPTDEDLAAVAPSTDIDGVSADDRCADAAAVTDPLLIDQAAILQVGFWTVDDPDPCDCDTHNVNCKNFGLTDRSVYPYDRDLPLGAVENWRVGASTDGHPFHIHTNPVIVCPTDGPFDPIPFPHWRDTYLVNLERQVDMVTKYRKFTGAFVFHCHKLTHEDDGMMQLMRVCDPATDPTCGQYNWRYCADGDLDCVKELAATDCALAGATPEEVVACTVALGGPGQVCGADACSSDDDCPPFSTCQDYVCQ